MDRSFLYIRILYSGVIEYVELSGSFGNLTEGGECSLKIAAAESGASHKMAATIGEASHKMSGNKFMHNSDSNFIISSRRSVQ